MIALLFVAIRVSFGWNHNLAWLANHEMEEAVSRSSCSSIEADVPLPRPQDESNDMEDDSFVRTTVAGFIWTLNTQKSGTVLSHNCLNPTKD